MTGDWFTDARNIWWLITVVIVGVAGFLFSVGWKTRRQAERIEKLESCDKHMREDVSMLLKTNFAVLDGLHQLNCNGNVTKALHEMQDYLSEKR